MIDFSIPDEVRDLESEIARFASNELRPRMRDFEGSGRWDHSVLASLDAFAVPGLDVPEAWGGVGLGALAKVVALESVAYGDAGGLFTADPIGHSIAAALACPDEALAQEVVKAALARQDVPFVLIYRAAGAWLPGDRAPARVWVSDLETLHLLDASKCQAVSSPAGAFGASGGIGVDLKKARKLGKWDLDQAKLRTMRGRLRLWPAAVSLGIAKAALDYGIAYAKERIVMGKPVAHHQANAFSIADAAASLEAARASVRAAAHRIDAGETRAGFWATLAYLDAIDAGLALTDLGVQLLGGHGYIEDHPSEKWFREARALAQLYGGRDAATGDAEAEVLDAPDPVMA